MRSLISFFVDRSLLANLITVAVIGAGGLTATQLTRAVLPDEEIRTIEIEAELPGASAVDVERFVTFRLEEALAGMEDVEEVRSTTTNGRVEIALKAVPDVDDLAPIMEQARSRLSAVQHQLPRDLLPVRMQEAFRSSNQILMAVLVESVDQNNVDHRRAVQLLAERLNRVRNVIKVDTVLRDRNLYVRFSREALTKYNLDVTVARDRILDFLGHSALGTVPAGDQEIAVELARPFDGLDDLRRMPLVVNRAGRGISLSQVATVSIEFAREQVRNTVNGRVDTAEIYVVNALGSDAIEISRRVREVLAAEAGTILPVPLTARVSLDVSTLISHEIDTLIWNGLGGVVLVLIILTLFLGWRVSAMTAVGLPFAYLGIVLLLPLFGINFNIISLVAMILMIGILVDDAIIVSEEFCQQLPEHDTSREAAISTVLRVGKPVLGMVATTTVAFLPFALIKSDDSWMYAPLPIIIIAALFISLFESFFILPNHLRHFMPRDARLPTRRPVEAMRRAYRRSLVWVLRFRYVAALLVIGLVAAAAWLVTGPMEFRDTDVEAYAQIFIELDDTSDSLDALAEKVRPVEELIEALPEGHVDYYQTTLGTAWYGGSHRGWKYAQIRIIPPGSYNEQELVKRSIWARLREPLAALEEKGFKRLRLRGDSPRETRDMVTIYVSGGDRIAFTDIQDDIRGVLTGVKDIKDLFMDEARFQRSFSFVADEAKTLSYGLTKRAVQAQLREHFSTRELLRLRHRGDEIEVFLTDQEQSVPTLADLGDLTVVGPVGVAVPLRLLGRWEEHEVLRRIEHRDMLRLFEVDAFYDREKTESEAVAAAIEEQLAPLREKHVGYHISVKPSEEEAKTMQWLIHVLIVCVGLIYVCLALALGSLVSPIVVIFAIPFGFTGVVFAFGLHGLPLSTMAVIGIAGLAGVVVNDSLVMSSTIGDVYAADPTAGMRAAITAGAARRFRAVILTSLTTLGGVLPMAYGIFGETGWIRPMVLAVGWGLLFATILTLYFLPALLLIVDDVRRLGGRTVQLLRPSR